MHTEYVECISVYGTFVIKNNMIILEEPYLSEMLLDFIQDMQIPVLNNTVGKAVYKVYPNLNLTSTIDFVKQYKKHNLLYTVSEYSLEWILNSLSDDLLTETISVLKNKTCFRQACNSLYDDFFFRELTYDDVLSMDIKDIQLPFVIKPTVGFLSVGVYVIRNKQDWANALNEIDKNFRSITELFPSSVVGSSNFILESYISGDEYAVDLYFVDGQPVIINIFEHLFASDTDVGDRLYVTSKNLFDKYLVRFTKHIIELNQVLNIKDMPVHIELRLNGDQIIPIEINPMRFTGLCLNELHYYISGKHPLSYFFSNSVPDYLEMWKGKEDKVYSFSIFNKPKFCKSEGVDFNRIKDLFSNILEFRPVAQPNLDIAAFVFAETSPENLSELQDILHYNTKQLIQLR